MPEPKNTAADIAVNIKSKFDDTGSKAAQKSVDDLNTRAQASTAAAANAMKAADAAATTATQGIFGKIGSAFSRLTQTFGGVARAAQAAIAGLGIIGVINQLINAAQMVKGVWDKLTASVADAGHAVRDSWAQARKEVETQARQDAALESLKAQKKYHDDILAAMRQEAAFAAQMRELEARRQGNEFGAQQAALEGALARDEVSRAEYTRQSRALEDRQRAAANAKELAPLQEAVRQSGAAQQAAADEVAKSNATLQGLLQTLASYTANNNPEAFARAIQDAAAQILTDRQTIDENSDAWRLLPQRLADLQESIRSNSGLLAKAAMELGVTTTKTDGEGKVVTKSADELANDIIASSQKIRTGLATAANEAVARETATRQEYNQAQERLAKVQEVQAQETAGVAAKRAEADATAAKAADKKAAADTAAAEAAAAATQREMHAREIADQRTAAEERQAKAQESATAAAAALGTWWAQNKDRLQQEAQRKGKTAESDFANLDKAVSAAGNGDPAAVATLYSAVEHMAAADAALRTLTNALQDASQSLAKTEDTAKTAADADAAAQQIGQIIGQQQAANAGRDQVIAAALDTLQQASAASPADAGLEQLQAMAQAALEDKNLTAQESAQLLAAANALGNANSAQGQRIIALLSSTASALNSAAANSQQLTARLAKVEAELATAQKRLAAAENR